MIARPFPDIAVEFANASAVLATATRGWPVEPPQTPAQLDAVGNQVEGLRRSLIDMRCALSNPKK